MNKTVASSAPGGLSLLDLPVELRLEIWKELLVPADYLDDLKLIQRSELQYSRTVNRGYSLYRHSLRGEESPAGLLRVSKRTHGEVLDVLNAKYVFLFWNVECDINPTNSPRTFSRFSTFTINGLITGVFGVHHQIDEWGDSMRSNSFKTRVQHHMYHVFVKMIADLHLPISDHEFWQRLKLFVASADWAILLDDAAALIRQLRAAALSPEIVLVSPRNSFIEKLPRHQAQLEAVRQFLRDGTPQ